MQANIQATEEQQKDLADQGLVTQFDQVDTSENPDLTGMEVTSQGITVKPMELIADGHFVHLSFQVAGYDLADGEEPCFEEVVVYTGEDETAECMRMEHLLQVVKMGNPWNATKQRMERWNM